MKPIRKRNSETGALRVEPMMDGEMTHEQKATLDRLLAIIERLYLETAGFQENGDNQQHWYNRGYANGIVMQLDELGYRTHVEDQLIPDAYDIIAGQEFWAWGKAYQHGMEMGKKETMEVIEPLIQEVKS